MTSRRPTKRTPVERLHARDVVRAVELGPMGVVIDADRDGWVIVQYHNRHAGGTMSYRRGHDNLILVESGLR